MDAPCSSDLSESFVTSREGSQHLIQKILDIEYFAPEPNQMQIGTWDSKQGEMLH